MYGVVIVGYELLDFNNVLEKSYLKELAEADDREVVKSVHVC